MMRWYNLVVPGSIVILEDNPDRLAEMKSCLAEVVPTLPRVFFENAYEMIAWLGEHLGEVVLISLDHDLPLRSVEGELVDSGDGRLVADFLAAQVPTCPVIVHSSNEYCAPGMMSALTNAGWLVGRVRPYDEHNWVQKAWRDQIVQYVRDGWIAT